MGAALEHAYSTETIKGLIVNSLQSPSKSTSTSPPKTGSSSSLNKFHNRLVDKLKRSLKQAEDCAEDQRNLS